MAVFTQIVDIINEANEAYAKRCTRFDEYCNGSNLTIDNNGRIHAGRGGYSDGSNTYAPGEFVSLEYPRQENTHSVKVKIISDQKPAWKEAISSVTFGKTFETKQGSRCFAYIPCTGSSKKVLDTIIPRDGKYMALLSEAEGLPHGASWTFKMTTISSAYRQAGCDLGRMEYLLDEDIPWHFETTKAGKIKFTSPWKGQEVCYVYLDGTVEAGQTQKPDEEPEPQTPIMPIEDAISKATEMLGYPTTDLLITVLKVVEKQVFINTIGDKLTPELIDALYQ